MSYFKTTLLLLFVTLTLSSCETQRTKKPSFLIIAVDQLKMTDVACQQDSRLTTHFDEFCQKAIRFSHAYTTSTLTLPALASILTAQYPISHGVRNNADSLSPSIETVSEKAFDKGYDTFFISGGAPVLRKSGLQQGFELFEDSIQPNLQSLHRPFEESKKIFFRRMTETNKQSFFSVIYVPDILFTDYPSKNLLGESRDMSAESQIEELKEQLDIFFLDLKNENLWDNTHIVLVGLNGRQENSKLGRTLSSDTTQVALLFKPAINVKFQSDMDQNTSLIDLGATFYELLDEAAPFNDKSELNSFSLLSHKSNESRWILSESAWPKWRNWGETMWSIRKGGYVCYNQLSMVCYDSLVDKEKISPLSKKEILYKELDEALTPMLKIEPIQANILLPPQPKHMDYTGNPCLEIFENNNFEPHQVKKCNDPLVSDLIQWLVSEKNPEIELSKKEQSKKKFFRGYYYELVDRKISGEQVKFNWIWDVSSKVMVEKTLLESIWSLPEMEKVRLLSIRSMSQLKREDVDY